MRLCCFALITLLCPSLALAQADVVVLSLGGDAPADQARLARDAVAAALAADGTQVLPDADVSMRIPPTRLAACRGAECAFALARELEVDSAVAVALWMGESGPGSISVSLIVGPTRSHSASEELGEGTLDAAAAAAVAAARAAQRRSALIEGPPPPIEDPDPDPDAADPDPVNPDRPPVVSEPASPLQADRSIEEWVLPSVLGVVGLALVGFSVYALLEEQCELRGPSGACLVGSAPNLGLGVTFAIAGTLAIAGAIIWLIVGGQPPEMENIDVVIGPEGGGVTWRGRF